MKLSELDKSKLPIKVQQSNGTVWKVVFVGLTYTICRSPKEEVWFASNSDHWSLYEEPKPKYALYAYKKKTDKRWIVRDYMYEDDNDFKTVLELDDKYEFKRLMWSEVEL